MSASSMVEERHFLETALLWGKRLNIICYSNKFMLFN